MENPRLPQNQAAVLRDASAGGVLPKGAGRREDLARAAGQTIKALVRRRLLRYDARSRAYVATNAGEEALGTESIVTPQLARRVSCPTCGGAIGAPCRYATAAQGDMPHEHTARVALALAVYTPRPAAG